MARTTKTTDDRRSDIMDAALRVFAQKGFVRATNKDIALEAGITTGLIYHYFESKGALLKTILEERSPLHLIQTLKPQIASQPADVLLGQLVARILALTDDVIIQRIIRVSLPELLHNSTIAGIALSALQEGTIFLEEFFIAKMESGELRRVDPTLAAQTFMGSVMGFIVRRQILRDPMALQYSKEQIVDYVVSATLQGLRPD